MVSLYGMMFWGLVAVSSLLLAGIVLILFWSESRDELVSRIMALVSGFSITGLAIVGGKSIPETLIGSILALNPANPTVLWFGVLVPALFGFGTSLLLVKLAGRSPDQAFRVVVFLATSCVVYAAASVGAVMEDVRKEKIFSERAGRLQVLIDKEFTFSSNSGEAIELLEKILEEAQPRTVSRENKLRTLAPNWSFLGAIFFYMAFFFRWPASKRSSLRGVGKPGEQNPEDRRGE